MLPEALLDNSVMAKQIDLAVGRAIGWPGDPDQSLMAAWQKLPEQARDMLALERFMQRVQTMRENERN